MDSFWGVYLCVCVSLIWRNLPNLRNKIVFITDSKVTSLVLQTVEQLVRIASVYFVTLRLLIMNTQ